MTISQDLTQLTFEELSFPVESTEMVALLSGTVGCEQPKNVNFKTEFSFFLFL